MSKGKDFRPRKRGFDDDGPMSYDAKPRRSFGGAPDAGFGGPPMGGSSSGPVSSNAPAVDATVKWFKADKGYGFVELAGGAGDAFLHANALRNAGHESVPAGAKLKVQVGAGAKGAQVTRVIEVDTAGVVERPSRPFERRAPPAAARCARSVDRHRCDRQGQVVRRHQGLWLRGQRGRG